MSDDELVGLLKAGDEKAFEELYERHASGLLRHLFHLLRNQQEAEELLHECMLLMIQKINFYTPNPSLPQSFKAWLYRLSTNRTIDELRKKKSRDRIQLPETDLRDEGQEKLYQDLEQEQLLDNLILKLPLLQRMVLSLRVQEDLTYTDISAVLGKDVSSIKQGLFQARKNMKHFLASEGEL